MLAYCPLETGFDVIHQHNKGKLDSLPSASLAKSDDLQPAGTKTMQSTALTPSSSKQECLLIAPLGQNLTVSTSTTKGCWSPRLCVLPNPDDQQPAETKRMQNSALTFPQANRYTYFYSRQLKGKEKKQEQKDTLDAAPTKENKTRG